jgi:3-oxoacyl-[acyl-carrier-protein] synthase II
MGKLGSMAQTDPRPLATLLYQEVPDYSYLRGIPCQSGQFVCLAAGFTGSNIAVYGEAAASGLGALAFAHRLIQSGELDRVIVPAVGLPLPPQMLLAYDRQDRLGETAGPGSGPFDRDRAGTLMGHGAVSIVIESQESAERRGAPIFAALTACESVNARTRREALSAAVDMVLDDKKPDMWWAHGAGSVELDLAECQAVGERFRAPTTGSKGTIGNLFEAAALVDIVLAVEALRRKEVPPVGLLENPDPELGDIDFVVGSSRKLADGANTALITALDARVASAGAALVTAWEA